LTGAEGCRRTAGCCGLAVNRVTIALVMSVTLGATPAKSTG
jgi:hypothetical protein